MPKEVIIFTDGGSRGNPGPAAASCVIKDTQGKLICAKAWYLGSTTNNVAEYTGVLRALETARQSGATAVKLTSDSELLVKQISGQYRVKSDNLRDLHAGVMQQLAGFDKWAVVHARREHNKHADELVNKALDKRQDVEELIIREPQAKPIRIAVLISGGGTTLLNLLDCIKNGSINAEIPLVISSRAKVAGVERAKKAGLNVEIIRVKDYADNEQFSCAIEAALNREKTDLVVQAGWLCMWKIPPQYTNRVMNIHPALLPSFGGRGMWGHYVHEAVIAKGCKVSGCTVHFATNEYDEGPIIIQRCCPVEEGDTPDDLAHRVFEQECVAYPEAIKLFQQGRIEIENGRTKIKKV